MRLTELLAPGRVLVPLPAGRLDDAIAALLAACVADGQVREPGAAAAALAAAHREDAVTVGPGAFQVHLRTAAVDHVVAALGVAPAAFAAGDDDEREAAVVVLVLAPPRETALYLQAVAAFGRVLAQPETVAALRAAPDAGALLRVPPLAGKVLQGQLAVRDLMQTGHLTVGPEISVAEAARLLVGHRLEALPVVTPAGQLLGMIGNRELLAHLVPAYVQRVTTGQFPAIRRDVPTPTERLVRDVMVRNVLCVSEEQSIAEVAQVLANKGLDRVAVVREGSFRGMLTRAQLVRQVLGR